MSIRPVEFNGMIQNTHDVSTVKQHEDNKMALQQQNVQTEMTKEMDERPKRVNDPQNANDAQNNLAGKDAKDKGSNSYHRQHGKKKQEDEKVDKVILKGTRSSFDIKI